jgi:hypothetical protein
MGDRRHPKSDSLRPSGGYTVRLKLKSLSCPSRRTGILTPVSATGEPKSLAFQSASKAWYPSLSNPRPQDCRCRNSE